LAVNLFDLLLFYEEIEYARVISFQFIKNGLEDKKMSTYISDEVRLFRGFQLFIRGFYRDPFSRWYHARVMVLG